MAGTSPTSSSPASSQARGDGTLLTLPSADKVPSEEVPNCTDDLSPHLVDPVSSLFSIVRSLLPWGGSSGVEEKTETSVEEHVGASACLISVKGLSFLSIRSDNSLMERCEAAVIDAIAAEQGGLALQAMVVEVMGGAHTTMFAVSFPDYVSQQELQIHLTRAQHLGKSIEARINKIQGIDSFLRGGDLACEVSTAASEGLVRFQGTWTKDTSTYVIRGSGIRFPSGGRAEMISHDTHRFSITHPSGVSFNAVLETNGLELRWTNGSTWQRSYGEPHSETAAATLIPVAGGGLKSHHGHHSDNHTDVSDGGDGTTAEQSEGPSPDLSSLAAELGPTRWGITGAQCKALLDDLRLDPLWNPDLNVEAMVNTFLIPRIEAYRIGYALLLNQEDPQVVTSLVLHAPDTSGEEILATVARSAHTKEVFYISSLSSFQPSRPDGFSGPSAIPEDAVAGPAQEDKRPEEEMQVLEHIQAQRKAQWCSRLCCGPMSWFPWLLTALAVFLFFSPIIAWGCVPTPDFSKCGARVPPQDLSWSTTFWWVWLPKYQEDWDKLPEVSRTVRSFTYAAVAGLFLIAAVIWMLHRRFQPNRARVLVIPGHTGKKRHDFGIGQGPSMLALDADNLQVPVVFAPGVTAPKRTHRPKPAKKKKTAEAESEDEVTKESTTESGSGMHAIREGSDESERQSIDEVHEEEKPEEKVLRVAARKLRWSQSGAVFGWALLLLLLRTADLSLALAGTWRWEDALCALAGVIIGIGASVIVLHYTVRHWRGKLPLWVACAFPGGTLVLGSLILFLLAFFGVLTVQIVDPTRARWTGVLDLSTDEAARYINPQVCKSIDCKRVVAISASFAQTLLVAGAACVIVGAANLMCAKRCLRLGHIAQSSIVIVLILVASVIAGFVRAAYVAGGVGGAGDELPETNFGFTVAVFMITQALARCALPVCLLIRLGSYWGVRVVPPRCCKRRSSSTSSSTSTATLTSTS